MESTSSPPAVDQNALGVAVLAVIGEGATVGDVVERFRALGAVLDDAVAHGLLTRLASLGLLRVASGTRPQPRYVLTSLGRQYPPRGVLGDPELTERLEELERLRTDLLATVGHELRTPLTAVRTCVGLLLDPTSRPDAETHTQLLQTIARSADRMQRLLTDVLDLARFRAGRMPLQCRRFDAAELTRRAASTLTPLLHERGQALDLELPPAPVWVFGDPRRLEQVLLNLLSNAQKFSPVGSQVRLNLQATVDEARWSVTDQGPGIAPDDQPRLFERFFTTPSRPDTGRSGTGLGLPIALAIVQAHGGTIEVATALGLGSTFTVRVPVEGPGDLEVE